MSNEKDLLKSLLLKEELKLLNQLKEKVLSEEKFTEEVSKVLSGAIKRAQEKNPAFEKSLSVPIQKGVSRAFTENKQTIIDGLLPIMGQLIRKTVSNSIKQVVTDINRILELGFSTKALKWRWQSFQTGESFAEIVFQKTIRYQVNEIFLINRNSGLLIEHVGIDDMLKDNNAISAMLSVIQEFVGDSLQSPDDHLQSAEIGDNLLFFSHGPKAFLTFVIKGVPTERFKSKSFELIENVHADFSKGITNESTYRGNLELQDCLRSQLITKNISDARKKTSLMPWIVGMLILVTGLAYWSYQRSVSYNKIVDTANSIEGLYLQSISRQGGKYKINGLVDPLADISAINTSETTLQFKPFISLDEGIIKKRVSKVLSKYKGYTATINKGTITLTGLKTQNTVFKLIQHLKSIPGINYIENNTNVDSNKALHDFLEQYLKTQTDQTNFEVLQSKLFISGFLGFENHRLLTLQLKDLFPNIVIVDSELIITNSNEFLIKSINNTKINLPLLNNGNSKQIQNKQSLVKSLQSLLERGVIMRVTIVGESDCHGSLSDRYSMNRAESFKEMFTNKGIDKLILFTEVKKCIAYNGLSDESKLNVSFNVKQ